MWRFQLTGSWLAICISGFTSSVICLPFNKDDDLNQITNIFPIGRICNWSYCDSAMWRHRCKSEGENVRVYLYVWERSRERKWWDVQKLLCEIWLAFVCIMQSSGKPHNYYILIHFRVLLGRAGVDLHMFILNAYFNAVENEMYSTTTDDRQDKAILVSPLPFFLLRCLNCSNILPHIESYAYISNASTGHWPYESI